MITKKFSDFDVELLRAALDMLEEVYPVIDNRTVLGWLDPPPSRIMLAHEIGKRAVADDIRVAIQAKERR